jgi:hypothetical protein
MRRSAKGLSLLDGPRPRLLAALTLTCFAAVGFAQSTAEDSGHVDFRSMLADAGIGAKDFETFNDWDGNFNDAQAALAARLFFRLEQAERSAAAVDAEVLSAGGDNEPGELVQAEGRVESAVSVELPAASTSVFDQPHLTLCTLQLIDGPAVVVLTHRSPAAWKNRPPDSLDEPVALRGVVIGSMEVAGERRPVVLTNRLQWRPVSGVSGGVSWLVEHGFDASLLDEVRQNRPLAKPPESREAEAFYRILDIVSQVNADVLVRHARSSIPTIAKEALTMADELAERREAVADQWKKAPPSDKKTLRAELDSLRRRQAMAAQVGKRAEQEISSVWPMFIEPEKYAGELFHLEGTARRAVRIVVDDEAVKESGLREYYELDVFTTDSQNQPIICCVPRLPDGFPTGEVIREPVRVAGIFFKRWAYARRSDDELTTRDRLPETLAPPLVLAATPEWLRTTPASGMGRRGLWGGAAFLAVVLMLWIVLAKISRGDRLARDRRACYDSPLENLAEP